MLILAEPMGFDFNHVLVPLADLQELAFLQDVLHLHLASIDHLDYNLLVGRRVIRGEGRTITTLAEAFGVVNLETRMHVHTVALGCLLRSPFLPPKHQPLERM